MDKMYFVVSVLQPIEVNFKKTVKMKAPKNILFINVTCGLYISAYWCDKGCLSSNYRRNSGMKNF